MSRRGLWILLSSLIFLVISVAAVVVGMWFIYCSHQKMWKMMNWRPWLMFNYFLVTQTCWKTAVYKCSHNNTINIRLEIWVGCKIDWSSPLSITATNIMNMHKENQKFTLSRIEVALGLSIWKTLMHGTQYQLAGQHSEKHVLNLGCRNSEKHVLDLASRNSEKHEWRSRVYLFLYVVYLLLLSIGMSLFSDKGKDVLRVLLIQSLLTIWFRCYKR